MRALCLFTILGAVAKTAKLAERAYVADSGGRDVK